MLFNPFYDLWSTHSEEAIHRGITSVATYINGRPILPMEPSEFWKTSARNWHGSAAGSLHTFLNSMYAQMAPKNMSTAHI